MTPRFRFDHTHTPGGLVVYYHFEVIAPDVTDDELTEAAQDCHVGRATCSDVTRYQLGYGPQMAMVQLWS